MNDFDCFAMSKQGVENEANEDFAWVEPEIGVFGVADGVGGGPGGAQASRTALMSFVEGVRSLEPPCRLDELQLRRILTVVNNNLRHLSTSDPLLSGMGTTLSVAILTGAKGKVVHIGDSRVYLLRAGKLRQITHDHTLVAELLERDHLTAEEAKCFPLRHLLSRCLGTRDSVEPDFAELDLSQDDWLILASDGVTKALSLDQLLAVATAAEIANARDLCERIMLAALAKPPQDDVTAVVVRQQTKCCARV
jgi:protein phosphatase